MSNEIKYMPPKSTQKEIGGTHVFMPVDLGAKGIHFLWCLRHNTGDVDYWRARDIHQILGDYILDKPNLEG